MIQMLFMSMILLSLGLPAHAALDEKGWKEMSDEFQLGYLWGMMDTTVTKVWDHKPTPQTYDKEMTNRVWREGVDKHMAECIRDKIGSPMKLQALLDTFMTEQKPEPSESIQYMLRQVLWRTCVPSP